MGSKKSGRYKQAYTPEVHRKIIDALKAGAYKVHAANAAYISVETLEKWVLAGREGVEPYVEFARDVDQARAEDALRCQSIISAASMRKIEGDWKAAAWCLERKFPKLYGRRIAENTDDAPSSDTLDREPAIHSPWLRVVS